MNSRAEIELVREAPFDLGHLRVRPAARRLESGAWSLRIEPRAMQVLVALARAAPEVVGRGELNEQAWGGRIVGNDAINRVVQTLRRAADQAPPPVPFVIETIPRVGYRLATSAAAKVSAPQPRSMSTDPSSWAAHQKVAQSSRSLALILVAAIAMIGLIVAWWLVARHRALSTWVVERSTAYDDLPADASDAAISPDGRRIAYRSVDLAGRERIFVRQLAGGAKGEAVSPAAIDARRPAWSHDGAALAFAAYDAGRPCRLYVVRFGRPAFEIGTCESMREPQLAWSLDGRSLLFGDAPGINAVLRIVAINVKDGHRTVVSSPPGDAMGDTQPAPRARDIIFQREFGWADEGWVSRDAVTGGERLLWRRRGVVSTAASVLPNGALAIIWTCAGASRLDVIERDGRTTSVAIGLGQVAASTAGGARLLVETSQVETALVRAGEDASAGSSLAIVRGRISGPLLLPDGRLRFPAASAGLAQIWERDRRGNLNAWGSLRAARIAGLALSPDGRHTAALVTGDAGREIVVLDPTGRPTYRWNPRARSLNAAAWTSDGRRLVAPMLDGAGWRLFELDPFGSAAPRDLGQPGFAVVQSDRRALYAVRAGEATGIRELWRLDVSARRLPIDLTLFDIVNWAPVGSNVWLPDRAIAGRPALVLRDGASGRILRRVSAPALAGAGSGLAADARGAVYVRATRDTPAYSLLDLRLSQQD